MTLNTGSQPDAFRLPLNLKPTHYDLTVRTDLNKLLFHGFVKIDLDVKEETSTVILNTADLELGEASIYSDVLKDVQLRSIQEVDNVSERAKFHFKTPLPAGSKAQLKIGFQGKLTGNMLGYYKSSWEDKGKTKYYALTQFEPTAARRAFPCWDEPLLKATYAITLISRADTVNLSNMPVISEKIFTPSTGDDRDILKQFSSLATDTESSNDSWKITQFETTPPMSSYIVAFANGHFEHLESSYKSPLSGKVRPLRIYATSDIIHQAQFALDVKAQVLPLYEQVFDVEYPLPKLDTLVASDFDAGAMENWGLITGRTSAFLLDPKNADLRSKKAVANTQSHEVAHMWFGNITTMEWWNYLYLNEGFATLMGEVIIANKIFPEWKVDTEFITDHLNSALSLDAKLSSHPIEVDCPDANHINQIFDGLSYSKAASVLRMLSNYVGEERFLKGVSIYMKKRLYANSVTNDLWEGIAIATGIDIVRVMDNWISKIGFPVVTVTENKDGIQVRQDRFLETGHAKPEDNETIWTIPLSLLTVDENGKGTINRDAVLSARESSIALDINKPFKLNAGTVGVFRVLYTPERLAMIASEAVNDNSAFSLNDRIGLVHDTMALARAGFAKVSSALTLVDIFRNEKEYLVWDSMSQSLSQLVSVWWEEPHIVQLLNGFRQKLFAPLVEKLGYEYSDSESVDTSLLRTVAISQAAAAGDPGVIQELRSRFAHFVKTGDDSNIPADLQRVAFRTAVQYGGREEWEIVKGIHDKPKSPSSKISAILAMSATEDPQLAKETLQYILTNARDQDVVYFFRGFNTNSETRRLLVEFFKHNYDRLYHRFEGNFTLKYLVENSFAFLSTNEDLNDVTEFFQDKDTSKYNLSLSQTLDSIRAKIAYLERSTVDIQEWLEEWQKAKL